MNHRPFPRLAATAALTGAGLLLLVPLAGATEPAGTPLPAQAGDFALKIEAGAAFPLSHPQSQRFKTGVGETIKGLWTINEYLDAGPSLTFLTLPRESAMNDSGTAWAFGGGLRLKRPHHAPDDDAVAAISPWLDADALYVRTGSLNRPGFAVGAGLAVPIGHARIFWLGPFVRYLHIMQGERTGFDNHDAKVLIVGLSLEVGSGVARAPEALVAAVAEVAPVTKEVPYCADRDKDAIPDTVDRCPDVKGSGDNYGCPQYKKIIIKSDKLELKERLYFAWNQAALQEASFPMMDEVVQALKENKGFRVQVEGHTSSEGGGDHNQTLSEQRAAAVLDYLVTHGIDKERLVSKGFAGSVPADTNATVAGRENNRRVEFVVHFNILNDGTK